MRGPWVRAVRVIKAHLEDWLVRAGEGPKGLRVRSKPGDRVPLNTKPQGKHCRVGGAKAPESVVWGQVAPTEGPVGET